MKFPSLTNHELHITSIRNFIPSHSCVQYFGKWGDMSIPFWGIILSALATFSATLKNKIYYTVVSRNVLRNCISLVTSAIQGCIFHRGKFIPYIYNLDKATAFFNVTPLFVGWSCPINLCYFKERLPCLWWACGLPFRNYAYRFLFRHNLLRSRFAQ